MGVIRLLNCILKCNNISICIGWSARWVYLSTSVWIQPEPERWLLDSDTSAEITHPARTPIPYAFSRTLQVFKHSRILFMTHFMTHMPRYVYLGIGVIMGNVIRSGIIQSELSVSRDTTIRTCLYSGQKNISCQLVIFEQCTDERH